MGSASEEFWERIGRYRELGINPLRWVAGCAVKVDLPSVVYPALRSIRKQLEGFGVQVSPREDADIFPANGGEFEVERRVYDIADPKVDANDLKKLDPWRAISLIQVHLQTGGRPEIFAEALLRVYSKIGEANVNFTVGKGHSIITTEVGSEFALFDFLPRARGTQDGWNLANNDTIQLIDPTVDPGSEVQAYTAASNSLNDLLSLGCYENLKMKPVIDAPNEEIYQQISSNMKNYAQRHGIKFSDAEGLGRRSLLIGATFTGRTWKEPPTFYEHIDEGMEILVSRAFGDLAPITVYLSCLAEEYYADKLRSSGLSLEELKKAKDEVVKTTMNPNIGIGKLINSLCPPYGGSFREDEHIAATGDVSGPGVYIFKELAEKSGVDIVLDQIPLLYPDYVNFASSNFLMDNGTAGTNGAVAVIASKNVIGEVERKLKKEGVDVKVIGRVLGKGSGTLQVGKEVRGMIGSKPLLDELEIVEVEEVKR